MNHSADDWIKGASDQLKIDPQSVKDAINQGDIKRLTANMSQDDMAKVQAILNDQEKMEQLLRSPAGKALMKLFGNKR